MLRFLTSGESHGKCLLGILEGLPAGLPLDVQAVDADLRRRQLGYGRGGRMRIERDQVEFVAGVRHGATMGSPIAFTIQNRDWSHWSDVMSPTQPSTPEGMRPVTRPRPGHADLAGALKFQTHDARNILERASARETATRVAVGAICKTFVRVYEIRVFSHVLAVGPVRADEKFWNADVKTIAALNSDSSMRCLDPRAETQMISAIDSAKKDGDTLGGILEVVVSGVPPGLGSCSQWDMRLDGLLAQALMSIPAAKAVEIGNGIAGAGESGSQVHDEIFYDRAGGCFFRGSNRAGGLEGGITNGSDLRARIYMKPIPTLRKPLRSVDLASKESYEAAYERSDTCVVAAAGVIAEAMAAFSVARAFLDKFGGDSMTETTHNYRNYISRLRAF